MVRPRGSALLLFIAATAWAAPPYLLSEVKLEAGAVDSGAAGDQFKPLVAAYDGGFLVIFEDARHNSYFVDTVATRVTSAGTVLDPGGISVAAGPLDQWPADTACTAASCLVLWSGPSGDLTATQLDFNGQRLASNVVAAAVGHDARLAFGTTAGLVAYNSSEDIFGQFIDGSGVPQGAAFPISALPTLEGSPRVAALGDHFLVSWVEEPTPAFLLHAVVLDTTGTILGGPWQLAADVDSTAHGATAHDGGFAVAFRDYQASAVLAYRQLDWAGATVGPEQALWATGFDTNRIGVGDLNGALLIASTEGGNNILVSVGDADGGVVTGISNLWTAGEVGLAVNGGDALLAWEQSDHPSRAVNATFASWAADGGYFPLTRSDGRQEAPVGVSTAPGFFVAWNRVTADGAAVWGASLGPDGTPVGSPSELRGVPGSDFWVLAAFSTGARQYVAWAVSAGLLTGVTSLELGEVGPGPLAPIDLDPGASEVNSLSAATIGDITLVAWSRYTSDMSDDLFFQRLDPDGGFLEPAGGTRLPADWYQDKVTVAATQGGFDVFAVDHPDVIAVRRFLPSGQEETDGGVPLVGLVVSNADYTAVGNGNLALVVFMGASSSPSPQVQAVRVLGTTVLDPTPLVLSGDLISDYSATHLSASWDGRRFLVAYNDAIDDGGQRLSLVSVYEDGGVSFDGPIAGGAVDTENPTLVPGTLGRTLVAYAGYEPTEDALRPRVLAMGEVTVGGFCLTSAECLGGTCNTGVCCVAGVCTAPDAGSSGADGGSGGPLQMTLGCGCGAVPLPWAWVLLLAALTVAARRRRPGLPPP